MLPRMQRFKARITRDAAGEFIAAAVELPNCWSRGHDRAEAFAKLREEIRYRIEYCPCSGVADDFVELDVVSEPGHTAAPAAPATPALAVPPAPAARRRHASRWSD